MYIGIQCHVSVTWLHVFVTPISKHVATQYRWQGRDFNRRLETCEEEETCVAGAIPKCTRYKNKWAAGIFDNLQRARFLNPLFTMLGNMSSMHEPFWYFVIIKPLK